MSRPLIIVSLLAALLLVGVRAQDGDATAVEPSAPWRIQVSSNGTFLIGMADKQLAQSLAPLTGLLEHGSVRILNKTIDVIGVTRDAGWPSTVARLEEQLAGFQIITDLVVVNVAVDIDALCRRMMQDALGPAIGFRQSSLDVRSAALGQLERIAAVAIDCPDLKLAVTGHSDSSGNEASNQALSLARAEAVVEQLVQLGVAASQLQPTGRGSVEPVADNSTIHGRAANRRVEVILSPP